MSRRDLVIYILIAVFGVGAAAVVSAVTMTRGGATPYLLWIGLSAVFTSMIGLVVMLVNGGSVSNGAAGAAPSRAELSANGAYAVYVIVALGIPAIGFAAVNVAKVLTPKNTNLSIIYSRPSLKGAISGDLSNATALSNILSGRLEDVSGVLVGVHENSSRMGGDGLLTYPSSRTQVSVAFDDGSLSSFSTGDHLYARCRIEAASPSSINLGGCQTISADQWLLDK